MKKFLAAILAVSIVFGAGTAVFDSAEHRSMKVYASSTPRELTVISPIEITVIT